MKPVSVAAFGKLYPSFTAMPEEAQQQAVAALNLVPAPCGECEPRTIAQCIEQKQDTHCPVLKKLARRAFRLAGDGKASDMIKVAVNYPDQWFAGLGDGNPVTIHLFQDNESRFAADVHEIQVQLSDIFGEKLVFVVHDDLSEDVSLIGVRARPTWFVNGHRFRGVQSVNALGRFVAYELADKPWDD